jgi:hypothetical protein
MLWLGCDYGIADPQRGAAVGHPEPNFMILACMSIIPFLLMQIRNRNPNTYKSLAADDRQKGDDYGRQQDEKADGNCAALNCCHASQFQSDEQDAAHD